ncbi:MAG: cytochrome c4 [Halieaceae bacterium]|jgi:cytochrome c553|nr:cytochrome c4 [Halieaceae bacterium]MBT6125644.1 cytochrome c4 [Halieaceae bacterium]
MKKILILASLLMGWSQIVIAQPGDAAAGEANSVVCSACHGADGNSAVASFPKLAGLGEKYLLKQLMDIRDGGRPIATMVGLLDEKSDQDLANLAAFYAGQARSGSQANPDLVALGEKVYRSGVAERKVAACTSCHSPNGKGNAPAGFPALAGQHADYIAAQLKAYRKGYEDKTGRTNDGESKIMRTNAFGLSDKEIEAVASYAAGLK